MGSAKSKAAAVNAVAASFWLAMLAPPPASASLFPDFRGLGETLRSLIPDLDEPPAAQTPSPGQAGPQQQAPEQQDPKTRMDRLFDRLQDAADPVEAAEVEEQIWKAWLDTGSDAANLVLERSLEALEAEDTELARDLADYAARLAPESPEVWNRRATVLLTQEQVDLALLDFNEALTLEPRHFGALVGLGLVMESLGEDRAAYEAFRRALALHPHLEIAQQRMKALKPRIIGETL